MTTTHAADHTHTEDAFLRLGGDRTALISHLRTHHGPWPVSIPLIEVDMTVLRQLHQLARHRENSQELISAARHVVQRLKTRHGSDPLMVFAFGAGPSSKPFTMGTIRDTLYGAEVPMFDDTLNREYVLEIRAVLQG